jgi:hypothetical protein
VIPRWPGRRPRVNAARGFPTRWSVRHRDAAVDATHAATTTTCRCRVPAVRRAIAAYRRGDELKLDSKSEVQAIFGAEEAHAGATPAFMGTRDERQRLSLTPPAHAMSSGNVPLLFC